MEDGGPQQVEKEVVLGHACIYVSEVRCRGPFGVVLLRWKQQAHCGIVSAQLSVGKVKGRDGKALALHHGGCQDRTPMECERLRLTYSSFHTTAHSRKCRARTCVLEHRRREQRIPTCRRPR
jgi:hypothetical protein